MTQYTSLFYKEWHKTKYVLLLSLLVFMSLIVYKALQMRSTLQIAGPDYLWEIVILKGFVPFDIYAYLTSVIGIVVGLAQFAPERNKKRLKLTLHLPMEEWKILTTLLVYGILVTIALFAIVYGTFIAYSATIFPAQVLKYFLATVLLNSSAGIIAYLLTVWVMIEPTLKRVMINIVIGCLLVSLLYVETNGAVYAQSWYLPIFIFVVAVAFVFHSLIHFKEGVER